MGLYFLEGILRTLSSDSTFLNNFSFRKMQFFAKERRNELPQSKPDGFASSLGEGASGAPGNFAFEPETVPLCQRPHPRGGCRAQRD